MEKTDSRNQWLNTKDRDHTMQAISQAIDILKNKTKPNTLYLVHIYEEEFPCGTTYHYKDNKLCYEFSSNPDFNFANHSVPIEIITREHRWNWRYTIKMPIFEEVL